jgi:Putative regulator of cell autolysis
LFWLTNAAGWFTFLLLSGLFFSSLSDQFTLGTLAIQLFAWCYYVPASGLIRHLIHRSQWFERKQHGRLIIKLVVVTFLLAFVGQFLVSLFMMYGLHIMTWQTYSMTILSFTVAQYWIVLSVWTLLYLVIGHYRANRRQQLREIELTSALHKNELLALKAQLNPHFIFNCLNNMRAMTLENAATTRTMITHLSEILKYSFRFSEQSEVTVRDELQHIRNYLALEDIHFEQRLSHNITVSDDTLDAKIPPMSIQLLVENAIKHGIAIRPQGGHINIDITRIKDELTVSVVNDGQLRENQASTGIGLNNLRQRLKLMYPGQARFTLSNQGDDCVSAKLLIPFTTDKQGI